MAVQDRGLKPRHDIGKQQAGAVLARIVRVPYMDEPGNPFVLRDAGQENLIKIGAKVVRHGPYVAFRMTAAAIPRYLFAGIPRLIAELRPTTGSSIGGTCSILVSSRKRDRSGTS